jgi:DNA-directed RNA polymerase subunit RPC12/RpoP
MRCTRCRAETDWLIFDTVTEAKRGIPCEACNR